MQSAIEDLHYAKERVEGQLARLVEHSALRSSKRLVSFLKFVVRQSLAGSVDHLKERTIGVEVFDRDPNYDTGNDHIVRTAASELRKRLAVYYRDDAHRDELRIDIPVGSYIPQFTSPKSPATNLIEAASSPVTSSPAVGVQGEKKNSPGSRRLLVFATLSVVCLAFLAFTMTRVRETSQSVFWSPIIRENRPVLLVVGDMPQGPPGPAPDRNADSPPSPRNPSSGFPTVALGDAIAMTRIATAFAENGKTILVRSENAASFSDLQNGPTILLGAFNNAWSLRFSRPLRFSLAIDPDRQLLYIRDRRNPSSRSWSVIATDQAPTSGRRSNGQPVVDFALVSRIIDSETGKPMVIMGGLYAYGTEAASTLMTDPQFESLIAPSALRDNSKVLQIVVQTDVTEGVPGPPKIVAYSEE
jgi:hypothetical protein